MLHVGIEVRELRLFINIRTTERVGINLGSFSDIESQKEGSYSGNAYMNSLGCVSVFLTCLEEVWNCGVYYCMQLLSHDRKPGISSPCSLVVFCSISFAPGFRKDSTCLYA